MNEIEEIDTEIIRDIALSAQQVISEVLSNLNEADDASSFASSRDDILAQLENIGMIADMSGLKGLHSVCTQLGIQFVELPLSSILDAQHSLELLNSWLLNILIYLENWQSEENIEKLIADLTGDNNNIRQLLLQDIAEFGDTGAMSFPDEDAVLLNNDDFPDDEAFTSPAGIEEVLDIDIDDIDAMFAQDQDMDLESVEGIMALLCQELVHLQPQIDVLTQQLVDGEEAELIAAATEYTGLIGRLHNTSNDLGLSGLVLICEFIVKNINLVVGLEPLIRSKSSHLLKGWAQVVIDHLQSPKDDDLCMAVVNYLENDDWPEPLKYSEIRNLMDGLTRELELTGDYEVEARSKEALPQDVLLVISEDTSQQLLDAFFAESPGHAEELTVRIADIIAGKNVQENTRAVQRISHTLKGSANLIGTIGIANFAHHLEDIFDYLAKNSLPPPAPLANTMQEAADTIEVMIESLQGRSPAPADAQRILQDVINWANRIDQGNICRESDKIEALLSSPPKKTHARVEPVDETHPADHEPLTQTELLRVPRDTIDQIFNLIGETSIAIAQIQEQLKRLHERGEDMRKQEKILQSRRFELENLVSVRGGMVARQQRERKDTDNEDFDSLEMDQYDEFYSATHSFIEVVSDTRESSRDVSAHIQELDGLFLHQQRLNRSLQDLVMTTRMVPVKTIVARLQRAVRQASRTTGKQAKLVVIGEELLMDGDVLNQLADPLMHLLRNAIDHGIEPLEERIEKGKPHSGQIELRFYQEGNSIRVNCSDDGRGLDYERIRRIALERNLINAQEETDNARLARIILSSGFSTRDKATHISGRGIGMDVVYNAIMNLKGHIDIGDSLPSGTNISLRMPITLLTSHSILVQAEGKRYAIPTSMLDQILSPGTGHFSTLGGDLTFQLDRDVYPAKSLAQLLGLAVPDSNIDDTAKTVLLARFGSEIHAVTVEHVVSSYDLVVKNMGRYIKNVPGIAGVALLGDGGVVPVLDIVELLDSQKTGKQQFTRPLQATTADKIQLARVLIVDDSLSVRKSLSQLVQDAGYEPILARDGIEALEVMQKTMPNLILTDLEMPRMTGLELAIHVRSNPDNINLPIMMITSRTMVKHQEEAQKAGINEYITKPFSEDELVTKIGEALHG